MKIAIIGHGNVGGTLANIWADKGHEILIGAREPSAEKVKALTASPGIAATTVLEAAGASEALLLATPPAAAPDLARQLAPLKDKVVIDATNAISGGPDPYPTAFHAFEDLTRAEVVKCFNTTGYENMANPVYGDQALDMFMAGDSETAKRVAQQLALDAGFGTCYDFGGADRVELLEKLAFCWINLAIFQQHGRNIGLKLLRREAP